MPPTLTGRSQQAVKAPSRNDIGQQLIVDTDNLVFKREFTLFQALELQLVRHHLVGQRGNGRIKITMLLLQRG